LLSIGSLLPSFPLPKTHTKKPAAAARPTEVKLTDRVGYRASETGERRGVKGCG